MESIMSIQKNEKKYKEHLKSKFSILEDVFVNTDVETDNEDIDEMFYNNAEVVFSYEAPEPRSAFYPGAEGELEIWGVLYDNKYFLRKELPSQLKDWLWEHLWENLPDEHKLMP